MFDCIRIAASEQKYWNILIENAMNGVQKLQQAKTLFFFLNFLFYFVYYFIFMLGRARINESD